MGNADAGLYGLSFKDSHGDCVSMAAYRGTVLLLVNTATRCGLAPQLQELEALHQEFGDRGFAVIGFPCNQFAWQEPVANGNMQETCRINYGVSFLLSERIKVNGPQTHPIFAHLKREAGGGLLGRCIKWNFTKFLVSGDGAVIRRYSPITRPSRIGGAIRSLLGGS